MSALAPKIAKLLTDIEALELPAYVERISVSHWKGMLSLHCDVRVGDKRAEVNCHNLTGMTPEEIAADMLGQIAEAHAEMNCPTPADAEFGSHFSQVAA